jgi:hypothetical protein
MRHGNLEIQEVRFNDDTFQVTAPVASQLVISPSTATTSYTLSTDDMLNKYKALSHSAPITLLVPSDTVVPCPIGTSVVICNYGTSDITVAAGPNAIINTPQSLKITGQYSRAVLIKTEPNTWEIDGNIASGRQVFIFPVVPRFVTKILDRGSFVVPPPTTIAYHKLQIVEQSSAIYDRAGLDVPSYGILWKGPYILDDSWTVTNSNLDGLYLKATILTPGKSFDTTSETEYGNTVYYTAEGVWKLFVKPVASNSYADQYTNPQWKLTSPRGTETQTQVRIDVSLTASDTDIIGHFFATVDPVEFDTFIFHQTVTTTKNYIFMNIYGQIFETDSNHLNGTNTPIAAVTVHPEFQNPINPFGFTGLYYRVNGTGISSGSGSFGVTYPTSNDYNGKFFSKPSSGDTITLEILNDVTGVLIPYCSVDIQFLF